MPEACRSGSASPILLILVAGVELVAALLFALYTSLRFGLTLCKRG